MRWLLAGVLLAAIMVAGSAANQARAQQLTVDPAAAQNAVHFVLDVSGSMSEEDGAGKIKLEAAKQSLIGALRALEPEMPVGLRAPTPPGRSDAMTGSCTSPSYRVRRHR